MQLKPENKEPPLTESGPEIKSLVLSLKTSQLNWSVRWWAIPDRQVMEVGQVIIISDTVEPAESSPVEPVVTGC